MSNELFAATIIDLIKDEAEGCRNTSRIVTPEHTSAFWVASIALDSLAARAEIKFFPNGRPDFNQTVCD